MEPTKRMKKRMLFGLCAFTVVLSLLIVRVGFIQIVQGQELKRQALEQQTKDVIITPKRGTIYDCNGKVLAVSASVETVYAHPAQIKNDKGAEIVAAKLAEILEMDYDTIYQKITKNVSYVDIKKKVEKDVADKIRELKTADETKTYFQGIGLSEDSKRYYPMNNLASQVIGFVGTDNQGLAGIEAQYDGYLKGTAGKISSLKNASGVSMDEKHEEQTATQDGNNLVLTIDETIQHFLENHLKTAAEENKLGNGACGIIMNVKTGEILAMGTEGSFNLNDPFTLTDTAEAERIAALTGDEKSKAMNEALQKMWRNKAVSDSYEPGSTFKIIVTAAALEEKVVTLEDQFSCSGSYRVADRNIKCWKAGGHGAETFQKGVQNSCNPVFMQVGLRLGQDNFLKYFNGFGLSQKTGIDLPGEAAGIFHDKAAFKDLDLAIASFGQGFQITPLELITAVSAVANGGYLMEPHVVKEIRDSNNNVVETIEPKVVRQIVSEETSKTVCSVLESVVTDGSASKAYIAGYHMAGKTGTSEKIPRNNGKYIASFMGFAPSNDPEIACLVILDEPNGQFHFGGQIAAPVVHDIMEDTLDYLEVAKQYTPEEIEQLSKSMPNVTGKTVSEAKNELTLYNFKIKVEGEGKEVVSQMPPEGTALSENSTVILYTEEQEDQKTIELPDLYGKTYRQAKEILTSKGLNIHPVGIEKSINDNDIVTGQSPAAGSLVYPATAIEVETTDLNAH